MADVFVVVLLQQREKLANELITEEEKKKRQLEKRRLKKKVVQISSTVNVTYLRELCWNVRDEMIQVAITLQICFVLVCCSNGEKKSDLRNKWNHQNR